MKIENITIIINNFNQQPTQDWSRSDVLALLALIVTIIGILFGILIQLYIYYHPR